MRGIVVVAMVAAGLTAQPAVAQAPAARPSIQQQFEAASAALQAEHWPEALAIYQALEARLPASRARDLGIVRVREASALAGLGREEEAGQALRLGLPALPANDPSLGEDRYNGLITLAKISERALDYGEAYKDYLAAEPLVSDFQTKAQALRGLIQTGMFYDAPAALARADAAVAAAAALHPADKKVEALFRTMRGRVLLNMGRPAEASRELQRAVDLLGGLTMRVDVAALTARSDLAIAALQSGDRDKAREYLAWTGAGHFKEGGFPLGTGMDPAPCGTDLSPSDVAIVEFSVHDDGTVGYAAPIYSSRQGASALLFAEAVTGWSWKPDELKQIPPLFRSLTRMEVRCSTASAHPSVAETLRRDVDQWLEAKGAPPSDAGAHRSDAARLKPLQEELVRREQASGTTALTLVPVLADLASNDLVGSDDRHTYLSRGFAIARAEKAPPPVLAWFAIRLAQSEHKWWRQGTSPDALRALLADPLIGGDPRASAAVRLALAEALYYGKKSTAEAIAVLLAVPQTPGLDAHDPLRAAALARAASLQLVAGQANAAKATYAQSGLDATQCSLLDAQPRMKMSGASNADFPMEALRWGFEGWVKLEFDLTAGGRTTNVRPVIAYPPFVFEDSAKTVMQSSRYEKTFRPGSDLGCGGVSQHIRYALPAN